MTDISEMTTFNSIFNLLNMNSVEKLNQLFLKTVHLQSINLQENVENIHYYTHVHSTLNIAINSLVGEKSSFIEKKIDDGNKIEDIIFNLILNIIKIKPIKNAI